MAKRFFDEVPTTDVEGSNITPEDKPKSNTGTVNCPKLNLRAMAEPGNNVITELTEGQKVTIDWSCTNPDYYKVSVDKKTEGYCVKRFITID